MAVEVQIFEKGFTLPGNKLTIDMTPKEPSVGEPVTFYGRFTFCGLPNFFVIMRLVIKGPESRWKFIVTDLEGNFSYTTRFKKAGEYWAQIDDIKNWSKRIYFTVK